MHENRIFRMKLCYGSEYAILSFIQNHTEYYPICVFVALFTNNAYHHKKTSYQTEGLKNE